MFLWGKRQRRCNNCRNILDHNEDNYCSIDAGKLIGNNYRGIMPTDTMRADNVVGNIPGDAIERKVRQAFQPTDSNWQRDNPG